MHWSEFRTLAIQVAESLNREQVLAYREVKRASSDSVCCSFCRKSQDVVGKLISSPSDYPRAYICDECINVCNAILEDDRHDVPRPSPKNHPRDEDQSFWDHPLASELLDAVEHWIVLETSGGEVSQALAEMKKICGHACRERTRTA